MSKHLQAAPVTEYPSDAEKFGFSVTMKGADHECSSASSKVAVGWFMMGDSKGELRKYLFSGWRERGKFCSNVSLGNPDLGVGAAVPTGKLSDMPRDLKGVPLSHNKIQKERALRFTEAMINRYDAVQDFLYGRISSGAARELYAGDVDSFFRDGDWVIQRRQSEREAYCHAKKMTAEEMEKLVDKRRKRDERRRARHAEMEHRQNGEAE